MTNEDKPTDLFEMIEPPKQPEQKKSKLTFKERWLLKDKTCEKCGQVTETIKGITKQNLKRLITPKFTMNEMILSFILLMVILLGLAYQNETKTSRDWIESMTTGGLAACQFNCNNQCNAFAGINTNQSLPNINISLFRNNELNESNDT